jgi:hypothetical protein
MIADTVLVLLNPDWVRSVVRIYISESRVVCREWYYEHDSITTEDVLSNNLAVLDRAAYVHWSVDDAHVNTEDIGLCFCLHNSMSVRGVVKDVVCALNAQTCLPSDSRVFVDGVACAHTDATTYADIYDRCLVPCEQTPQARMTLAFDDTGSAHALAPTDVCVRRTSPPASVRFEVDDINALHISITRDVVAQQEDNEVHEANKQT